MLRHRVIPCLLLEGRDLVKTSKFRDPVYVGDPVNAVRIFNEKEVDELILLDIGASTSNRGPNFDLIAEISSECFMPLSYGGGVRGIEDMTRIFSLGVEKIVLNTQAFRDPEIISRAAGIFGSQSVLVSIDSRRSIWRGHQAYYRRGTRKAGLTPVEAARRMQELGAGEIIVHSIDRDGTGVGYDLDLLSDVASSVDVPVIAMGGAGSLDDLQAAIRTAGVSAVAAGQLFVFHGKHKAVLINYPPIATLENLLG